jgi:hypothetical protein
MHDFIRIESFIIRKEEIRFIKKTGLTISIHIIDHDNKPKEFAVEYEDEYDCRASFSALSMLTESITIKKHSPLHSMVSCFKEVVKENYIIKNNIFEIESCLKKINKKLNSIAKKLKMEDKQ